MAKYAYVVAANEKYLVPLNIFLNSLEKVGNRRTVHLISWALPKDYLAKLTELGYEVIVHEVSQNPKMQELGEGECLMRYRYKLASELDCDAVCVFDADSLVVRNLGIWFEIAAKSDVIIGVALEQKRWYGEGAEEHHRVNGKHLIPKTWNDKDIACSPIFFNPGTFGHVFRFTWSIIADYDFDHRFKAPDMDAINLAILYQGVRDRVIDLAEATWSGLHETLLKPLSHVCEIHDQLFTINGEPIWVIHGQYLNPIWQGWQVDGQMGMIDRELDGSARCKQIAGQCMDFLIRYFRKMNEYKIKL